VNPKTRRAYPNDVAEFSRFAGLQRPAEPALRHRAHVIAWRKELEARQLAGSSIRRKLSAVSSLFDYLCERNAVAGNPVDGVKRPLSHAGEGELVNELIEAKNRSEVNRITNRWMRYELIVIDEMAYVAMPEAAAELLFQVISGRAERAAVIVTTNLPFSEWTTMFPNARLCKAMLDRLTDQAHIIDTGTESYRFRRTLEKKKEGKG
jgi:hypothetical protein